MSVQLNPAIANLDKKSLCYKIYNQLYNSFYNAHDKKDKDHLWGITEGDDTSIRLHNTAYNFAEAIAFGVTGSSNGEEGVLIDYLKKTGGNMTGLLRSNYGFEAGISNTKIIETYKRQIELEENNHADIYGLKISGELEVGGTDLYIGGENIISYNRQTSTTHLSGSVISLDASTIRSKSEFIIGESKVEGVYLSPTSLLFNGYPVYHSGNANKESIDWTMKQGNITGDLFVKGKTKLSSLLSALEGFELGINNNAYFSIDKYGIIHTNTFLSFSDKFGIKIADSPVLLRTNDKDIQIGAIHGDLYLGSAQTNKIKLFADIFDIDGDYRLLTKYGAAYFPDSLKVRHNYGDTLLTSYRNDSNDEGIIIHKFLRFNSSLGGYLYGKANGIVFGSTFPRLIEGQGEVIYKYETILTYQASTSKYQPLNKISNSLLLSTEADFITANKPIESKEYVGIDNSFTRISDGCLFFTDEQFLLSGKDGIKHYGNSYFLENLSTERFSSGFAGQGWAIIHNKTTGNIAATFDELTIRKKMRIYELEVQKISATNGSLWVSDNCSADKVEKIN